MTGNKINQLKAGVTLHYVAMGLKYVIAIIYTPFMLRTMGQSEYGLYTLVASVVGYLSIMSFGFGSAYIRYYSRYKVKEDHDNIAKLNGMFIVLYSVIGVLAFLVGIGLLLNTESVFGGKLARDEIDTAKILMTFMVFNISKSLILSVFGSHIVANEKYVFQQSRQILSLLGTHLVMIPVLLMGYKSIGMVVVTTVFSAIIDVSNILFCLKKLEMKFSFKNFDFPLLKEMAVFSSFIFVNIITDQINWNVDKFLLGKFCGTAVVAIYGVASMLNSNYLSFSAAISSVFVPRVNRLVATGKDDRELSNMFTRIGRVQFIVLSLICSGIIFFGRPFIFVWVGPTYSSAYPILLLLILPVTVPLIQNIGIEIQRAKNMHKFRSSVYFIIAIANLLLSIPLTKKYGGVGAAAGTAISLIIGNGFVMNWYYQKKIGLDIKHFWAQIFRFVPSLVAPVLSGILLNRFLDLKHILPLLFGIIIYTIIFVISMWLLGMNRYEKDLIGKPVLKVLNKFSR